MTGLSQFTPLNSPDMHQTQERPLATVYWIYPRRSNASDYHVAHQRLLAADLRVIGLKR